MSRRITAEKVENKRTVSGKGLSGFHRLSAYQLVSIDRRRNLWNCASQLEHKLVVEEVKKVKKKSC